MDDGQAGLHGRITQVREESLQLLGGQHALVGDGSTGQGCEVDAQLVLRPLADPVAQPLQVQSSSAFRTGVIHDGHEEAGHGGQSLQTQSVRIGGY